MHGVGLPSLLMWLRRVRVQLGGPQMDPIARAGPHADAGGDVGGIELPMACWDFAITAPAREPTTFFVLHVGV